MNLNIPHSTVSVSVIDPPPPFGKRAARRRDRRSAILAVAAKSFLEHGYAGTTMSGISAALGGSKGTLWSYFSSKEELFAAYLDEATALFRMKLLPLLDVATELRPALQLFARRFIEEISSPESISLHRLAVSESVRFPEVGRMFYERAPASTEAILASFLADHMNAGRLRQADPARAASIFLSLCMRGRYKILFGYHDAQPDDADGEAAETTRDFLRLYHSTAESLT